MALKRYTFHLKEILSLRYSFILSIPPSPSFFSPSPFPEISHSSLVNSVFLLHWF